MTILVLGFGAFGSFAENPSAKLALAVHGREAGRARIVGLEMPVSYRGCLAFTRMAASEHRPAFILGIGVAANRDIALVEEQATNRVMPGRPDVDGCVPLGLGDGPDVLSSPDAWLLAQALGVGCSPDAGRYVCNAWLYQVLQVRLRAGFLHIPPAGFDAELLVAGLARIAGVLTA